MAKTLNDVLPEILARGDAQEQPEPAENEILQPETPETQAEEQAPVQEPDVEQNVSTEDTTAEQAVSQQPTVEPNTLDAILTATEAYQRAQQENAQLKARIAELEAAMQQQSQAAENAIVDEMLEPPEFPLDGFEYLSDEERAQRLAEYNSAMAEYTKKQILKEISPAIQYFQQQSKLAEYEATRNALASSPELKPLMDDFDGIDRVIQRTPELESLDPQRRLIIAALINKGIKAMNNQKQPTPEEIASQALQNPEAMRIIETKRAQQIAQKNQNVPKITASSGMSSAVAMPEEKPKGWGDAFALAKKRLK